MRRYILMILMCVYFITSIAQVNNHLNNNNDTTRTFHRITNQNSMNGGLTLGINGGNNNGNNGFLNLRENRNFIFSTANSERMRITNLGYIGIGITSPITLLDINGQATIRNLQEDVSSNKVLVANSIGTLFYRDATDFLGGGEDNDWTGSNTGQMFASNLTDRVSVGISSFELSKFTVVNDYSENTSSYAGYFRTNAEGKSGGKGILSLVFNGDGGKTAVEGRSINNDESATANNTGVKGSGESAGYSNSNTGVSALATGNSTLNTGLRSIVEPNALIHYGIQSVTRSGSETVVNLGIRAMAQPTGTSAIVAENAGVKAEGWHSPGIINNYGIRAFAVTAASGIAGTPDINYGIYAKASGSTTGVERAGYFQGDVEITGTCICPSDRNLKNNIHPFDDALAIIDALAPKTYSYKQDIRNMELPVAKQWGFVAQELNEVLPELVFDSKVPSEIDDKGNEIYPSMDYKSVNYISLIPILVQAVKEQQAQIDQFQIDFDAMNQKFNELEGARTPDNSTSTVSDFSNKNSMAQNKPNPFNASTKIEFQLSDEAQDAAIYIYDMNGKQLDKIIVHKNESDVTIQARQFSPGMYIYSLLVDGVEVATKRMIITD